MSQHAREVASVLFVAALLAGCSGGLGETTDSTPVTVTGSAVTVTASAVTATADNVVVTPPAVTAVAPTVTATAPAVTVTADAEGRGGTRAITDSDVLRALDNLPVKGRAPNTGYDRDEFGAAWTDAVNVQGGRNGCDTRNDILRRDLEDLVVSPGTSGCVALTGTLPDPYSAESLPFERGEDSGSRIHIDHLVSLSNAWQTGAQQLSVGLRTDLANDPLNLWAVQGSLNQQKGDGDAATWLPPYRPTRCELVAHQVAVKAKYGLWLTPPEAQAIERVLGDCPGQLLPTDQDAATPETN